VVGDGRKALLSSSEPLQVVTVDALRPQSAYSGNVYSVELYQLVKAHLAADGLFAQWIPTDRVLHSVAVVFPHLVAFEVPSYFGSRFLIASPSPIRFEREALLERLAAVDFARRLPRQQGSLTEWLRTAAPQPLAAEAPGGVEERLMNRDLFPRDEYFLQQP
jgi:spermidine synthase